MVKTCELAYAYKIIKGRCLVTGVMCLLPLPLSLPPAPLYFGCYIERSLFGPPRCIR
jgi:hypothetical protein